jgi:uncharacterized protein YjiS (DUF1127 family)
MRIFIQDMLPLQSMPSAPKGGAGLLQRVTAAVSRAGDRFAQAMERSRQRRALRLLSDHQLADIGLTREQVLADSATSVRRDEQAAATPQRSVLVDDLRSAA